MKATSTYNSNTSHQVWLEQLRVLHSNQLTTFLGSWVTAVFLLLVYQEAMPKAYLASWLVFATLVAAGRIIFWHIFRPSKFEALEALTQKYVAGSIVGSYASGTVWAIFVIFVCIFPVPDLLRITVLFILVGLGASGIFALASVWHVYMGFFATAYIPVVLGFGWIAWRSSSQWYVVITLLSLLYLIINTRFAWKYHSTLLEALRLRFANQELAIKVQIERDLANSLREAQQDFIVNVSHDLRQPMQALSVFSSVLNNENAKSHPTPKARELGELIGQSCFMLSAQIEQLLDLRRIDQERLPKIELVNIACLLERVANEMKFIASQRKLDFRWRTPVDDEAHWDVLTDPLLFERVIRNLLDNAFKYTQRGGVLLALRRTADIICIEVIDTGVGMNTQSASLNPKHPEGFGFGLNIVKRICERLGHEFSVKSRVGQGTRCRLQISHLSDHLTAHSSSISEDMTALDEPKSPDLSFALQGKLWLLDDDPLALKALGLLLQPMAQNVRQFQSIQDFEAAMGHADCPDMVVLDWQLGFASALAKPNSNTDIGLSGQITSKQLIRELREEYNRDVPVCVVSANISHAMQELSAMPRIAFLQKPASSAELAAALSQLHRMTYKPNIAS